MGIGTPFHNLVNKLTAVKVRMQICEKECEKKCCENVGMLTVSIDKLEKAINVYLEEMMNDKIRIAFYKNTKKPVNGLISLWTWIPNITTPAYSHVEVGFRFGGKWKYFSSTNRGGYSGCRWEEEKNVIQNKDSWDVYEIAAHRPRQDIIDVFNSVEGAKYDWWGIAGFATPFVLLNSKKKWYCSEACYYGLVGKWKKRISPRGLFKFIKTRFDIKKIV